MSPLLTPEDEFVMSTHSRIETEAVSLEAILNMREEYRREIGCQIVHDSWHARGLTTSYLLRLDGRIVGYGAVGGVPREPKDTVKEFFLLPPYRGSALALFRELIAASGAHRIEAQTNDPLLLLMLLDCATGLSSETVLFADGLTTQHAPPGVVFQELTEAERQHAFPHAHEPVGEFGLVRDHTVVATGGLTFHYNPPYADLYMEVAAPDQRHGLGSYLVQELKRVCYEMERIPAARCNVANVASRSTLQRAGMFPCARIVQGTVAA
jgi:GNAT superfamily N-acetyltransferase